MLGQTMVPELDLRKACSRGKMMDLSMVRMLGHTMDVTTVDATDRKRDHTKEQRRVVGTAIVLVNLSDERMVSKSVRMMELLKWV